MHDNDIITVGTGADPEWGGGPRGHAPPPNRGIVMLHHLLMLHHLSITHTRAHTRVPEVTSAHTLCVCVRVYVCTRVCECMYERIRL